MRDSIPPNVRIENICRHHSLSQNVVELSLDPRPHMVHKLVRNDSFFVFVWIKILASVELPVSFSLVPFTVFRLTTEIHFAQNVLVPIERIPLLYESLQSFQRFR